MKLQTQANFLCSVDGDYKTNIKGAYSLSADGKGEMFFGGTLDILSTGGMTIDVDGGGLDLNASSAIDIRGSTIDLNKGNASTSSYTDVPDIDFKDSRGFATYEEGADITAPIEAIVLSAKPRLELPDTQKFMGDDDVEKSIDDLKTAVANGDFLPTTFSDYSYNALEGRYNTESAARRLIAEPRVPNDISEHGAETGENPNISSVTAGNTSVPSVDQVTLTDDSIDYSLQISKNYKLGDVSKNAVYGHAITPQHGLTAEDIVNNLKNLATNVLDPIKTQYPNMFITSGFRPAKGTSQHERGMVSADMQFSGAHKVRIL